MAGDGTINVAYYDDSYDPGQIQLGMTLARSNDGIAWTRTAVHTELSDPNHARWFSAPTDGKTIFIGDYNGLAVDTTGKAHLNWTDLRRDVEPSLSLLPNRIRGENIFYALVP